MTSTTLAGTPESVGEARAWLRSVLAFRGVDRETIADAALVLSELASNAVTHSRSGLPGGTFTVTVHCESCRVRIAVTDDGSRRTTPSSRAQEPSDTSLAENGRGLLLVEHHASDWWATLTRDECTVTADIPTARTLAEATP
ncbi:ATP-binding protein [Spiractinospora alimapuensis]|uniref:ATP-binding protein n=1 Tax=Spiractinospora alimapuensis TaxID=2820884 RepID=UPI001F38F52D|nr:ATP-binding protein [Spiractinospora alimapuensis]QVQ53887.1 ATP-binding protein [Spiractinospora alimapuensis]